MPELAYSLHLGSDKNRKNVSRARAKSNASGTTSLSNNAIQNARQLSRVDKHNYRKYDDKGHLIEIVRGTTSLYSDVQKLYKDEFEEARLEYNSKQTRDDRKIDDYFKKISDNSKNDLACEIIIELGDKKYWDTKDEKFKHKMSNVYKEQVKDLETLIPNFKVASAIIHYDETSPHMHIVGVPIKHKSKNGMSKQVGKSDVFTKTKLIELQDKMRTLCIASFNKEYGLNNVLKTKQKGRNKDINVKDMGNYIEMQEELSKNKERLEIANKKSLELDNNSNDVKDIVNNLKTTFTNKDKFVLNKDDKDKIDKFIQQVDSTNKEYKKMQKLSITLNDVETELKENREKVKILTENNNALNIKVKSLEKKIDRQEDEIDDLKEKNSKLQTTINFFENLFDRLVKFIKDKMFGKEKEREDYWSFSKDLYTHRIFSDKTIESIQDDYIWNKENDKDKDKGKDDYEIGM
mgnify:FL=1